MECLSTDDFITLEGDFFCDFYRYYYARSERSERSAQLLAFKRENSIYSRTKNGHFSMSPFRGCGFTYGEKHMNVKGVTHGSGPLFASKRLKTDPKKDPL